MRVGPAVTERLLHRWGVMRPRLATVSMVAALGAAFAVGTLTTSAANPAPASAAAGGPRPVPYIPYGSAYVDGLGDGAPYEYAQTPGSPESLRPLWTKYPTNSIYGYDFSHDTKWLYGVETNSGDLVFVNQATGQQGDLGYLFKHRAWHIWTDFTVDPSTGIAYGATASLESPETTVYRIDLQAAETTELMTVPMIGLLDMSMNCEGMLYGIDRYSDRLFRVDLASGLMIPVGPLGYDIEYAQGIDFDNATGILHAWLFTASEHGVYARIDTSTGAATPFPGVLPDGEYEAAIKNTCGPAPARDCAVLEVKVIQADAREDRAHKRVKKAKASGNQARIKKAKAKWRVAKRALRAAKAARAAEGCPQFPS